MNILIFSANWYNRGDESAIRAMIDELKILIPNCEIKIHFNQDVEHIPYSDIEVLHPFLRCAGRNKIKNLFYQMAIRSNGFIPYIGKTSENFYKFIDAVKWADYAIYAPGGPCIGDYYNVRKLILDMIELIVKNDVPFSLFAPSVGPFSDDEERISKLLNKAEVVCFRESVSQGYFRNLCPEKRTTVTLDSAFQHPVDMEINEKLLDNYKELKTFLEQNKRVIGVTITDLMWHRNYKNTEVKDAIKEAFMMFIDYLKKNNYAIVFIPQLFGNAEDRSYMSSYANESCFVMTDEMDCYFQQYVISKLYAVVGMRYHSNIFSAKMGTPFISVSYEQKMKGFMEKSGLTKYCIDINELTHEKLRNVFETLLENYDQYKAYLMRKKDVFARESAETTRLICESISER